FKSGALKLAASAIVFIFLIPYTASLYNGLSRLFGMAFNIDYSVCVIAMAILTGVYVIAGGYMATAINDFIQGLIMIGGIIAVIAAVLNGQGGFMEALDKLGQVSDPAVSGTPGVFASFFGPDPLGLLGVVLLTSLGTWGLPQMVQKFYAIKSEQAINKGMIISTVFAAIVAGGCYFLGGFGRLFADKVNISADGYDAIIPAMLADLPTILIAIVVILVLSASMSTLSSLVLTSASTLTLDFIKGKLVKNMKEKTQLLTMRILIVVFIAISVVIAIVQYQSNVTFIAQLMGISWGALAGAFLAPFLYGLYWKRVTKTAVWVNFTFSSVFMIANIVINDLFPPILKSSINAGAFCMLAGLVIVPVVSLFTKAPAKEHLEHVFSCYDRTVEVKVTDSIGEEAANRS
ncbi:MAG: sodium:solute symporter family protein, partial [Clostridia bacterium]|nr:sodium:solute symporter family protein [Clostridia bacterium]